MTWGSAVFLAPGTTLGKPHGGAVPEEARLSPGCSAGLRGTEYTQSAFASFLLVLGAWAKPCPLALWLTQELTVLLKVLLHVHPPTPVAFSFRSVLSWAETSHVIG